MRPASGRISPSASFRIRLLPEPATPNTAFVSPRASRKETPRSTSFAAKESVTFSNTMAGAESSFMVSTPEASGKVGADMRLMERENGHQEPGYEKVEHKNEHGGSHHRLGGG